MRCGEVMTAAVKKKSEKIDATMFDDVPVLRRKWQAALRPGEKLPRYEDVMLGSLGRLHASVLQIAGGDLSADQKGLIEGVLRDVLSPYREEDVAEVMDIVRANGGMEKIHLAFYRDTETSEKEPWSYWRLEGPGFIWNFRVLPHVHTFVNIRKLPNA